MSKRLPLVLVAALATAAVFVGAGCRGEHVPGPGPETVGGAPAGPPRHVETVQVNTGYPTAAFVRAFYAESKDRIVVTFGTGDYTKVTMGVPGGCVGAGMGYVYREYDTDMNETGDTGYFVDFSGSCAAGDSASVMVGDDYYFLGGAMGGPGLWRLRRFDSSWNETGIVDIRLEQRTEAMNDQMLAFAGGQLIASSLYVKDGVGTGPLDQRKTDPTKGEATFQKIVTTDLEPAGERVLDDVPHINGSSLVEVDGVYNLVTSRAFFGDLLVLRYDREWNFLGEKKLADRGQWAQGAVYDNGRYYVVYIDTSVKGANNVVLGVYDKNWDLVSSTPVTAYSPESLMGAGRPSIMKHGNRLYVSYDVESFSPQRREENKDWQGYIAIYET
ncbi:hypothetical protein EDM76_06930 [bacterium]|nr:MAG: hypothetical protein EDM76_06930 [bacterium]MCL4232857.1 hypothetical protein [Dehalococcoidia bacterium]